MSTITRRAKGQTLYPGGLISAKRLRDISAKALTEQAAAGESGVVALTHYNTVYGYFIPVDIADKAFSDQSAAQNLLRDWIAALPYAEIAIESGIPSRRVLTEILKDNGDGQVAIDFAGLARLMTEVPMRLDFNDDGTPITRATLKIIGSTSDDTDEDYTKIDVL